MTKILRNKAHNEESDEEKNKKIILYDNSW